jgi:hypothetical protein
LTPVAQPRFRNSSRKARTRDCISASVGGNGIKIPILRVCSPWARTTNGHETTALPSMPIKARRLIVAPKALCSGIVATSPMALKGG